MANDSTVEDWDTAAALWEYAITSRLTSTKPGNPMTNGLNDDVKDENQMEGIEVTEMQEKPVGENALLMTETGINPAKNREKGLEIAMENWGVPAYWLAQNGVLSAYEHAYTILLSLLANDCRLLVDSPPANPPP